MEGDRHGRSARAGRKAISEACRQNGVRRLVVFGSALTSRFDESQLCRFLGRVPRRRREPL